MKNIRYIVILIGITLLSACKPSNTVTKSGLPEEFTVAWEEIYGRCYDSIPHAVVALDLYSEGLDVDTVNHQMHGTGYNLYLSDIFLPDRTGKDSLHLAPGTYRSGTSAKPYTFLPGHDYEGTPTGIYLLYVENDKLQSIQVLDSGWLVVRDTSNNMKDLQLTLYYQNAEKVRTEYKCHFQGALQSWLK